MNDRGNEMSPAKGTILVVDDNPSNLSVLSSALRAAGYDVRPAISGALALRSVQLALPDLILLDIRMPEMDGYEVCSQLKADKKTRSVPVIFVSAMGETIDKVRAFNVGGVDYITKPFQFEEVLARVGTHVTLYRSERRLRFLSSKLLTIQEEERQRTAKDIHDRVSQSLAAIKVYLECALCSASKQDIQGATKALESLLPMLQNIIRVTRSIYMGLRPSTLDDLGIIATLQMTCRQLREIYPGLCINEVIEIQENDIPHELKIVIFRIAEEALLNAAKYSQAVSVCLYLGEKSNAIELTVEDDGVGFDPSSVLSSVDHSKGFGLSSMRERAELAGGSFCLRSLPGEGTTIRASWPHRAET